MLVLQLRFHTTRVSTWTCSNTVAGKSFGALESLQQIPTRISKIRRGIQTVQSKKFVRNKKNISHMQPSAPNSGAPQATTVLSFVMPAKAKAEVQISRRASGQKARKESLKWVHKLRASIVQLVLRLVLAPSSCVFIPMKKRQSRGILHRNKMAVCQSNAAFVQKKHRNLSLLLYIISQVPQAPAKPTSAQIHFGSSSLTVSLF